MANFQTPRRELEAQVAKLEAEKAALEVERRRWFLDAQGLAARNRELTARLEQQRQPG